MYIWEFFAYIFFGIRKPPTREISTNSSLVNPTLENSDLKISHLEYSHPSFLIFFQYCHHYLWYYSKECFLVLCFKDAEVFTFVNISQNEGLSEERQLMKWVGITQVRTFWMVIFRVRFPRGEFDGWEFLGREFPRGDFHWTVFFI